MGYFNFKKVEEKLLEWYINSISNPQKKIHRKAKAKYLIIASSECCALSE